MIRDLSPLFLCVALAVGCVYMAHSCNESRGEEIASCGDAVAYCAYNRGSWCAREVDQWCQSK